MKIAVVYDWFDKWGGVERILLTLKEIFPQADFFTSYYDKDNLFWLKNFSHISESFIKYFPTFFKRNRLFCLPFYPFAFESFNFDSYDLVISVTAYFAKGVITKTKTKHICYLLTPTRFLWSHSDDYLKNFKFIPKFYLSYLKKFDLISSQRPDKIFSISYAIRDRCQKFYQRKSQVIYPPFDFDYWEKIKKKLKKILVKKNNYFNQLANDYFLIVSRLEPYKKIDLVINLFNRLGKKLLIIGKGSLERKLKIIAKKNIFFLKDVSDKELAFFYQNTKGLIIPQEEDFGYVSLESQFFNCPVIAFKKGGVLETVIEKKTGIFFKEQKEDSLLESIERFEKIRYNLLTNLRKDKSHLQKFDKKNFINSFRKIY